MRLPVSTIEKPSMSSSLEPAEEAGAPKSRGGRGDGGADLEGERLCLEGERRCLEGERRCLEGVGEGAGTGEGVGEGM